MIKRESEISIIPPLKNEDKMSESRSIVNAHTNTVSDIREPIKTLLTNQNNSLTVTSSRVTENFIFIWLNLNMNDSKENTDDSITKLQHIVDSIKIFQDPNECIDFLTDIKYEQIFIIISGSSIKHLVSCIEDIPKLRSIYILDNQSTNDDEQWVQEHKKVKGIFTQIDYICHPLKKDIYVLMIDLTPFSIISTTSLTNRDELDQSFMYTQLLKEIILKTEYDQKARKEFVEFCLIDYKDNTSQIEKINKFDRDYQDHSPIWWYTTEWFVYSTLNKALRTQNVEVIIKMGFFLQDLHREIERKCSETHQSSKLIVYRGQGISNVDLDKLKKNKGGLLSFNNFLSTSLDRAVSFCFADSIQLGPDRTMTGLLFEIEIDPSISTTSYTFLDGESQFEDEKEVLFSMHTIFRINEINPIEDRLWEVKLALTSDNDPELKHLTDCMRHEIGGVDGWFSMGTLMQKMGKFDKALEVYETLLQTTFNDSSDSHNMLRQITSTSIGEVYRSMGNYSDALEHMNQLVKNCENTLSPDHPVLLRSYDGIGSVYLSIGNYPMAISYYEKVLEIWEKTLPSDHPSLIVLYSHIALAHHSMGNYSLALSYYEKVFQGQQKTLPFNHPNNAVNYHNIGLVYYSMGNYVTALSHFEEALEIYRKTLPPDHLDLALSYNSISIVHTSMGNLSMALSYADKALEIQKSGPLNHTNLAIAYSNIAAIHTTAGNYIVALSFFEKAIDIYRKTLPSDHPDLAKMYSNMGALHKWTNNQATALLYYEKACDIFEKTLPPDHSDWIIHYINIGYLHQSMGDYLTALSFMNKSFEICQKSLSSDHPNLACNYFATGTVHESMGNYSKALSYYEKALDIYQKTLAPNHPDLATIHKRIAWVSASTADLTSVLSTMEKVYDVQQKHLQVNHTSSTCPSDDIQDMRHLMDSWLSQISQAKKCADIVQKFRSFDATTDTYTINELYDAKQTLEDLLTSLETTEKVMQILQYSPLSNHPTSLGVFTNENDRNAALALYLRTISSLKTAFKIDLRALQSVMSGATSTCNNTDQVESSAEHHSAALSYLEKYFEAVQNNFPSNDPFMAGVYNNIGNMQLSEGYYSNALSYFKKALEILEKSFSNNYSMLSMTFSNMAKAFDGLGQYNEAIDYARKAIDTASADFGSNEDTIKTYQDQLDQLQQKL
jgi:tetratricopeptide (TPR) repeat protein